MREVTAIIGSVADFLIDVGNYPTMIPMVIVCVIGYIICVAAAKLLKRSIRTSKADSDFYITGSNHKKRDINAEYFRYIANAQYRGRH